MEAKEAEGVKEAILEATMAIMGVKEEILGEGAVAMAKAAKVALMEVAMGMGMGVRVETLEERETAIVLGETVTAGTAVKGGLTEAIVETGIALEEIATTATVVKEGLTEAIMETGIALEETATTGTVVKEGTLAETTATALAETAIMEVQGEGAVVGEV